MSRKYKPYIFSSRKQLSVISEIPAEIIAGVSTIHSPLYYKAKGEEEPFEERCDKIHVLPNGCFLYDDDSGFHSCRETVLGSLRGSVERLRNCTKRSFFTYGVIEVEDDNYRQGTKERIVEIFEKNLKPYLYGTVSIFLLQEKLMMVFSMTRIYEVSALLYMFRDENILEVLEKADLKIGFWKYMSRYYLKTRHGDFTNPHLLSSVFCYAASISESGRYSLITNGPCSYAQNLPIHILIGYVRDILGSEDMLDYAMDTSGGEFQKSMTILRKKLIPKRKKVAKIQPVKTEKTVSEEVPF